MKKNETGRSMVEMLGVLAIIGVLSIGGIAGYTLAMNRYRANEILDAASKVAIVAMSADGGMGNAADLSALGGYEAAGVPLVTANGKIASDKDGIVTIDIGAGHATIIDTITKLAGKRVVTSPIANFARVIKQIAENTDGEVA